MDPTSTTPAAQGLPAGRWWPDNHAALTALLQGPELAGRSAIFDWDNTCIHNDLGDAAFRWQLDTLSLAWPPHVLARQWAEPLALARAAGIATQEADALHHDAVVAWRLLWPAVVRKEAAGVLHTPAHLDFRAKLGALYEALASLGATLPAATAHVFGLLARMWGGLPTALPERCVQTLVEASAAQLPGPGVWLAATPGQAGCTRYAFSAGLRPFEEVRALMAALQAQGVRVAVVSASFEPLVAALAKSWAYPLARADIFGLRLAPAQSPHPCQPNSYAQHLRANYPLTFRAGKVACIEQHGLAPPVLVAGDAVTDLEMLTHWPQTKVRLLLHRPAAAAPISVLYRDAEACDPRKPTLTLLQGRNEVVGEFWPRQRSGPT